MAQTFEQQEDPIGLSRAGSVNAAKCLALIHSRAQQDISAPSVRIEVHLRKGLPGITIVGLAEISVRESRERIQSALLTNRFLIPRKRITINLAPADFPKEGGRFDLAIAIGILVASGQLLAPNIDQYEFYGELALNGELRPVAGLLPAAIQCRLAQRQMISSAAGALEAALIEGLPIFPARHLLDVCAHLIGSLTLNPQAAPIASSTLIPQLDMQDLRGQDHARRALTIAACGGHSILLIGPPGTGKTMLANRLPGILPPMSEQEAMETAIINSVSYKGFNIAHWRQRPFRAPHHSASAVAMVGGGASPRPGEISLAHNGVLFLDELPEFDRRALEALREPLETGLVTISRAARQSEFPARFQLVAAMNPCPCGYLNDPVRSCRCTHEQVTRYQNRVSGPLLDRIDLQLFLPRVSLSALVGQALKPEHTSAAIRAQVTPTQELQRSRQQCLNARLSDQALPGVCALAEKDQIYLATILDELLVSNRAYNKILRIARTIADLEHCTSIKKNHLLEAISFRQLDRAPNL